MWTSKTLLIQEFFNIKNNVEEIVHKRIIPWKFGRRLFNSSLKEVFRVFRYPSSLLPIALTEFSRFLFSVLEQPTSTNLFVCLISRKRNSLSLYKHCVIWNYIFWDVFNQPFFISYFYHLYLLLSLINLIYYDTNIFSK